MRVDGDGYHITGLKTTAHHEQDPAYLSWKVIRSANHKDIEAGFGGGLWTDYGNLGWIWTRRLWQRITETWVGL